MKRREFLGATGAAALALAGCGGSGGTGGTGGSSESGGGTPTPPPNGGPAASDWQGLAASLTGSVVLQSSSNYEQVRVVFNASFDNVFPQAVVQCASSADVSQALAFAQKFKLPLAARSGRHSYAGYSTTSGMVIDVGNMNTITLAGSSATIGAGAKLADIYSQLGAAGLSIPSGSCPTIGIAGITQGGGIGVVDRAYGLTCDKLISAQIVTADGKLVECDANNNSDLFWALRGGGGGNFGIVTSFTFQTFTTGDLTSFSAQFNFSDAAAVLNAWQTWPQTLPDTVWAGLVLGAYGSPGSPPYVGVSGYFIGTPGDFSPYWTQFLAAAGATPISPSIVATNFVDAMLSGCNGITVSQCHLAGETPDGEYPRSPFAASSDFFNAALPQAGIEAMLQAMSTRQAAGKSGLVIMDLMGGAIAKVAPDATAFVHRNAIFSAQYYADFALGTDAATVAEAQTWANGMRSVMQSWSSGEAYQNYVDPLLTNPLQAYYGSNLARLQQVKQKYDPNGVFGFAQAI